MATSSRIIHSFLRNELNKKKTIDALSVRGLLEFSRTECVLLEIDFDPMDTKFSELERLIYDKDAIFLHDGVLYHADNKNKTVVKVLHDEQNDEQHKQYNALKASCSKSYKRTSDEDLDRVMALTGRAFNKYRSNDFLPSLNFYLGILDDTHKVLFAYMDEKKKEQLRFDLKTALLLLLAQRQHELEYQKTENKKIYDAKIKRCFDLLRDLDPEYEALVKENPALEEQSDEKPIKYLGFALAREVGEQTVGIMDRKSKSLKEFMGGLNEKRLFWIWASVFLKTVISLVPEDFFYSTQAAEAIKAPDPYTGCLSCALYYFRFGLNLFLLAKHTIYNPWMSDEEAKKPWYDRFQTQWSERKFTLLNDSLWGTANFVCFFWLNGKTILGTLGDALTIALLIFDIAVAVWDFEEQKTKHNKQLLQYEEDMARLRKMLEKLHGEDEETRVQRRQLEMQIDVLERAKITCERDWVLQKVALINNIAYAAGLLLAFIVLTMPFMPIAAPVAAALGIAGAVLCHAFTVINNAIKGGIEIHKTRHDLKETKAAIVEKMKDLDEDLTLKEKQLILLEIRKLEIETKYQKQMLVYQSVNLVRSIMLEVLIPAVVFSCLMFFPLGIGIAALGAAIGLAIATHFLVDALFKPEEKKELEDLSEKEKAPTFFNKKAAPEKETLEAKKDEMEGPSDDLVTTF